MAWPASALHFPAATICGTNDTERTNLGNGDNDI